MIRHFFRVRSVLFRDLTKYLSVAVVALAADVGSLTLLVSHRVNYLSSATAAFLLGTLVNFILSNKYVFKNPVIKNNTINFTAFVAIGGISLLLNDLIIWVLYTKVHGGLILAKSSAVALTFFWNFLARRQFLYQQASSQHS